MSIEKPVRASPGSLGGQSPPEGRLSARSGVSRPSRRGVAELVSTAFQLIARQSRV